MSSVLKIPSWISIRKPFLAVIIAEGEICLIEILLRNALDAMGVADDREIDLIIVEGDEVVLTVRDSGPGIDDLDALFEPFYTTKKPGEGIGLGLAISSGIVKDLGGRLTARNGEKGGAVFEVRLPALDDAQNSAAAE